MILMLAPAANMNFASLPSGSTYTSDANALVKITNGSVADQLALAAAGCQTLSPIAGGAANAQPGTAYSVQPTDENDFILFTAGTAVTATLPNNLPQGFVTNLFQIGTGQVTATAAAGATVDTPNLATTPLQYSSLQCLVVSNTSGTNAVWVVISQPTQSGSGLIGATTLANLYSQDTSTHYSQYTNAQVYQDGTSSNNGIWLKTGSGSGSGNWTQVSTVTLPGLNTALTSEITTARAAEAEAGRFEPSTGYESADYDSSGKLIAYSDFWGARYQVRNGVAVPVGWKGGAAIPYYFDFTTTGQAFRNDANVDYVIILYGNSISLGSVPGVDVTITTSAVDSTHAFTFLVPAYPIGTANGYSTYPHTDAISDYQALYEQLQTSAGSYETPCSGCASIILSTLNTNVGSKPRLILFNAGTQGQGYISSESGPFAADFLKQGSAAYTEMLRLVQIAQSISKRRGRKVIVIGVANFWGHYEFSLGTPWKTVAGYISQHARNCDADIRQITGQTERVRTFMSQCNRGYTTVGKISEASWAVLKAQDVDPNVRCIGPEYYLGEGADGAHWTSQGYRTLGRQLGYFIVNDYFGSGCQPLHIVDSWWSAAGTFNLRYSETIAIDTAGALVNVSAFTALGGLYGIDFTDNPSGSSSVTISSATVVNGPTSVADTIQVVLTGTPANKGKVFIAARSTGDGDDGNQTGARSGIHSSSSIDTDPIGSVVTYKWACQEQRSL